MPDEEQNFNFEVLQHRCNPSEYFRLRKKFIDENKPFPEELIICDLSLPADKIIMLVRRLPEVGSRIVSLRQKDT